MLFTFIHNNINWNIYFFYWKKTTILAGSR